MNDNEKRQSGEELTVLVTQFHRRSIRQVSIKPKSHLNTSQSNIHSNRLSNTLSPSSTPPHPLPFSLPQSSPKSNLQLSLAKSRSVSIADELRCRDGEYIGDGSLQPFRFLAGSDWVRNPRVGTSITRTYLSINPRTSRARVQSGYHILLSGDGRFPD